MTTDSKFHIGFVPGQTYEFMQDMLLCSDPNTDPPQYFVSAPRLSTEWRTKRAAAKEPLPAGSKVEIIELWDESTLVLKDVVRVVVPYGILVDTPNEGKRIDLREVSTYNWAGRSGVGVAIYTPDASYLQLSSDPVP